MADNVTLPGDGSTVAADDVGGALYQRVKLAVGADGAAADLAPGQATMANSLPVALASNQSAIPVTDNSSTLSVDDGGGALTVDGTVAVSGTVAVTDNGGALTVDGTVTANLSATDNAVLDAIQVAVEILDNCISGSEAQVDIVSSALPTGAATAANQSTIIGHVDGIETVLGTIDGDTSSLAGCVGGTELQVDIVAALPAGANAIGKLAANSGVDIGDVDILSIAAGDNNIGNVDIVSLPASTNTIEVVGDVAHDAAAAGNPLRVGGYAANVIPAAVANADAANIITDLHGRLIVVPYAPPEKWQNYTSPADITDTADDAAFSAVASVKHYITHFSAMCSHATTGTWVYLKDGSTVKASIYCAAAGGGGVLTFNPPIAGTANTAVNVANATNSSATRVNVVGYQAP